MPTTSSPTTTSTTTATLTFVDDDVASAANIAASIDTTTTTIPNAIVTDGVVASATPIGPPIAVGIVRRVPESKRIAAR